MPPTKKTSTGTARNASATAVSITDVAQRDDPPLVGIEARRVPCGTDGLWMPTERGRRS